jgi:hypothetical protein
VCVAAACEGLPYKGAGRMSLAARCPARSSRRQALMAGADGQERHQCPADDALDEAEAVTQTGQYPWWRRGVGTVWLPGGAALDTRRYARTRAWTARLSALTHLSPTFGPGMDRPDHFCLFVSARWIVIYPFFYPCGRVQT